jgi:5'-3' exonuclease
VPVIRDVLAALGLAVVGAEHHEADDVIGTLATDAGMPVDIVTGDRDLFQLVDDKSEVRVLYTARGVGRHERVTDEFVVGKYGVLPCQYADFATMRGDTSDGLPGVAGIGEKTAASLLLKYGDLPAIVAAATDRDSDMAPGPRGKITAALDYLEVAPKVVAVVRDLDLGGPDLTLPRTPADPDRLVELTERWGLGSSVTRVVDALGG